MTGALEGVWRLEHIQQYCRETDEWPKYYSTTKQNMDDWEGELYGGRSGNLDRIFWFGKPNNYSIFVYQGKHFWVIESSGSLYK